ncbi:hypothetical protein SE17_23995 [Kouleothrix aurantiaca]|uniref:ABC transporter permease n=1 Tax=Kouleothrix aurantiaca TaxID=186479 RepID=A0A0P9CZ72_9CHLR|nr:hypothetical protein SE17_23995 [Kouleothrix aurantiaca]
MFDRIGVIFRKELTDHLRDRRTIITSLFYPLMGPLIVLLVFTVLGQSVAQRTERALELPVAGAENAPALVAFLKQHNVVVQPAPADPQSVVRAGDLDTVLVIQPGFANSFAAEQPAAVQLLQDNSRSSSNVTVERARKLLEQFNEQVAAGRLQTRGVAPQVVQVLAVEDVDLATSQSRGASFLNLLPYFIIFAVFSGGAGLAVDMTAGERERGSLEPLLLNPVPRRDVLLGKLLLVLLVTLVLVAETVLAFGLILNVVPLGTMFGVPLSFSPLALAKIYLLTLPMIVLASSMQMIVAAVTRGPKEAQSYLQLIPLVPALPGLVLAFLPIKPALWAMAIPTFGQQLLINQLMRGEAVSALNVLASTLITLLVGALLLRIALRLYTREAIVFGS